MQPRSTPHITPPKLLDQVRDRIRVKHYSIRTETQYVQWIRRFIFVKDEAREAEDRTAVDFFPP